MLQWCPSLWQALPSLQKNLEVLLGTLGSWSLLVTNSLVPHLLTLAVGPTFGRIMVFPDSFLYTVIPTVLLGAFIDLAISCTIPTHFYLGPLLRDPWTSGLSGLFVFCSGTVCTVKYGTSFTMVCACNSSPISYRWPLIKFWTHFNDYQIEKRIMNNKNQLAVC